MMWKGLGAACSGGLQSGFLDHLAVEKRLHAGAIDVVLCTVAAGAESWTASPTATFCAFLSYVWAPASFAQAEARLHRLSSDLKGLPIEIVYLPAEAPGGSLDDRMVEILEGKKALFAQLVDRAVHVDATQVHLKLSEVDLAEEELEFETEGVNTTDDQERAPGHGPPATHDGTAPPARPGSSSRPPAPVRPGRPCVVAPAPAQRLREVSRRAEGQGAPAAEARSPRGPRRPPSSRKRLEVQLEPAGRGCGESARLSCPSPPNGQRR